MTALSGAWLIIQLLSGSSHKVLPLPLPISKPIPSAPTRMHMAEDSGQKKRYKIKPRKAIRKFTTFHTHYTLWVFTFFYISFLAKTAVCRCHAPGVQVRPCEIRVQLPRDFWVFVCKFSFLVPTLFFSSSVFFFALALGKFRCCRRRLFSTPVDLGLAWSCPMRKTYNSTVAEIFQSYQ